MRGRIIFNNGQRPAFQKPDGTFADPDPVDPFSFQVAARSSGKLVGCARLLPCKDALTVWTETLLSRTALQDILSELDSSIELTGEAGRWIVDPEHEIVARYNVLSDGVFANPTMFVSDDLMPSIIFPDFLLALNELFPPKGEAPPIAEDENRL